MKVLSVVGARPQFVKAFPVSEALRREHTELLVHTGQHYDEELSGVFFEELPIPEPDHNLGVGSGSHAEQTAAMMQGLESLVDTTDPDAVLVYGDTNSTLAGALVAAKRRPALIHVEAGLRSGDRSMPEEVNRVLTDHVSDLLCVPSARARTQLEREGIDRGIYETGDVMYDAIRYARTVATEHSTVLAELGLDPAEYVLATVHRAANTDDRDRLGRIVSGLCDSRIPVVFPAHPRTVDALHRYGLYDEAREGLELIDPVGYLDFVRLLDGAARVATDSGGVQKEAFYLETPCVTLRETTEWTETVDCGWNVLVGADRAAIRDALAASRPRGPKPDLYGNGQAAERIVEAIDDLSGSDR
ncbi:non-hydrolyzing UDP-N-acetylglucosamine 2-epimerase [Halomicroarcula sp. GCM10025709]|uniref:non-hydrolyzing UDP-N-acetylglucosamine 2-epimerase n=1 Tax=Haloarcula TaxID=2237 RepID=UPI0024C2CD0C|nr:UDP-N-acetylglucosamine 2-epimerase (non-hydrolyzing) [Halomicroarcula sp. YJ-61-S]